MGKLRNVAKRGMLLMSALVLVAGYPASAMADTQEPTTEPVVTTQAETPSEQPPQTSETSPPAPIIIEPPVDTQPSNNATEIPSTSEVDSETTTQSDTDATTTVTAHSDVTSDVTSGDSTVSHNTEAGDAQTGGASASATLVNVVNSTLATQQNQKVATFTKDILGDVKGDIVLYPLLLKAMLEAEVSGTTPATVDATTNFNVNNTVTVSAKSGDATVDANTKAGDATTGSADAIANVVNILNSMIAAHDSFIGTINIYGNLEGDILIAPDFIPQLLANNATNNASTTQVSTQDTTTIVNNISAVAKSGAATVAGNTVGGDALTGDALSNVVIFNVTGHAVVAKNSLLVFVNVLGKWVGMIVDAPANATAAMIGNEVTSLATYAPDLTVNAYTSHGITNTVAVTAQSGDAAVTNNTQAGNAVSGQARALANIANVSGSQFGLSDWFGVLFINVFQSWYGSFGIDTAYGNTVTPEDQPSTPIQFIPAPSASQTSRVRPTQTYTTYASVSPQKEGATVLAQASTSLRAAQATPAPSDSVSRSSYDYRLLIIAGSILVIGLSGIGLKYLLQRP